MSSQPLFSESESRILYLYDKLEQLQLQLALLNARHNQACERELCQDMRDQDRHDAQEHLLEARATYSLRQHAVEGVLAAPSILKAVHDATDANPVECELATHTRQRDTGALLASAQGSSLREACTSLASIQTQSLSLARQNVERATVVLDLAEGIGRGSRPGPGVLASHDATRLEQEELAASRQRWRLIKGVAAGIVVGSGMDWVREGALRDMVLDSDD